MEIHPKVSILTTTYNHERFIANTIEHILNQEYINWELLVLDDGSKDGTWSIVQDFGMRDRRIRAFRRDHQGIWKLGALYNQGLEESDGEIIAILDGDDFWPSDKLHIQVPTHVELGVGITFGQVNLTDVRGRTTGQSHFQLAGLSSRELVIAYLEGRFAVPAVSVLVNRSSLRKIGGFVQPSYLPLVDYPTWITIGFNDGLGFLDRVLGCWRQYSQQTTWQLSRQWVAGMIRFSKEFIMEHRELIGQEWESILTASEHNRTHLVHDAMYREVIALTESGELSKAMRTANELKQVNQHLYLKARGVVFWKWLKKTTGRHEF